MLVRFSRTIIFNVMVSILMAIYRLIKWWQLSVFSRIFLNQTRPNNFKRRYQKLLFIVQYKNFLWELICMHFHCLELYSVNKFLEDSLYSKRFHIKPELMKTTKKKQNMKRVFISEFLNRGSFAFYNLHYLHIKQWEDRIIKQWVN